MEYRAKLRADCARCQGLCCVSLAFDRGESFAFDKPANVPCRHLEPGFSCRIHSGLKARGHAGCAAYDCYGAGQRISQELFAGVSWQAEPEARTSMFEAFRRLKRVHELRLLLHEAARLELSPQQARDRQRLLSQLEPARDFTQQSLEIFQLAELESAVHSWLRGLSRALSPERARRSLPLLCR